MSTASLIRSSSATRRPATALRVSLAVNAVVAAVALVIKFGEAATTTDPQFPTVFGRVTNELCYFTIQSNIIVLGVCVALAWRPQRWSWVDGVPRLVGLVCITVTGIVYYALLAGDEHFVGIAKVGDVLAHAVSPLLYVGTWLLLGPRSRLVRGHVSRMLVFPVFWVALTLIRGAIIHVYPYDFVDVGANGYVSVLVTIVALTAAAGGLAAAAVSIDRTMTRFATRSFRMRPADRVAALATPRRGSPAEQ
jgi:hypothetical protein